MSTVPQIRRRELGRSTLIVLAVVIAAALNAYALRVGASPNPPPWWSSLVAAGPVALLIGFLGVRWPRTAALGLVGLVAFGATLAIQVSLGASANPLPIAFGTVALVGSLTVMTGRARWRDVLGGLLLAYAAAALLFYASLLQ